LAGLFTPALGRGEVTATQQIADQTLAIAERTRSSFALTLAHFFHGWSRFFQGDLIGAIQHFQTSGASYNETDFSASLIDPHVSALCGMAMSSWYLGMADTARAQTNEAISLAERLKSPVGMAFALLFASSLYTELREPGNVQKAVEPLFTLVSEQQIPDYVALASGCRGWAMAERGRIHEGIALIRAGLDSQATLGNKSGLPRLLIGLSEAQARAGQLEEALATIEQAFSAVGEQQIYLGRGNGSHDA
jgi:tetratricopeptide (TPR) repeat protein